MRLIIKGTLPSLNDYIDAERANKHAAAKMKNQYQGIIMVYIKKCLGNWKPKTPVWMHYTWYEKDRRRDKDNVVFARKFIQDALVKAGTIPNDGWNEVDGFDDLVLVDKENPRIEVEIVEMASWNKHNPNNPFECCFRCPDRVPACSDKCERYAEARKIKAEQNRKDNLDAALGRAEKIRPLRNAKKK